jgi:hypothetical protein
VLKNTPTFMSQPAQLVHCVATDSFVGGPMLAARLSTLFVHGQHGSLGAMVFSMLATRTPLHAACKQKS